MKAFRELSAIAVPLAYDNIDTDQIIPKQFLKRIERTGYGEFLFYDWRRVQEGPDEGKPRPDFILNQPQYAGGEILLAGKNFGCGSSREHAAWALDDYGFRCVIAPSFGDIFYSNAGKNGILLVTLPEEQVRLLQERAASIPRYRLHVSLEERTVSDGQGFHASFAIDSFRRDCLLKGLDDIGLSLRHSAALDRFERSHDREFWLLPRPGAAPAEGMERERTAGAES
jgi:3-isopropylmalate/(R)-2-methylmalate dehydratase small subunit